jgi:ATP-binding cassette, subfamily B, bacterial PglK
MSDQLSENKSNAFFKALKSIHAHTNQKQKRKLGLFGILVFVSAVLDVVGLAAVLPLIKTGSDPQIIHTNKYLSYIYTSLNFEAENIFCFQNGFWHFRKLVSIPSDY